MGFQVLRALMYLSLLNHIDIFHVGGDRAGRHDCARHYIGNIIYRIRILAVIGIALYASTTLLAADPQRHKGCWWRGLLGWPRACINVPLVDWYRGLQVYHQTAAR